MTMHLSQIALDIRNRKSMRTLSDIYLLHQFVMAGFFKYEQPFRVLFRVEPEMRENEVTLIVQSHVEPAWEAVVDDYRGVLKIQSKEFSPLFRRGSLYRFRLRANPVVTREGKRLGLIRDEALINWLRRKEERVGATFLSVLAIDEGYAKGTRRIGGRTEHISIKTARFEGKLEITEPSVFLDALSRGLGPGKAFGCGLLSLARG
jgi:CRISPR system Cascade subunit CasE